MHQRLLGTQTSAERSEEVLARGAAALERFVAEWFWELGPLGSFTVSFAAPLPCSASERSWRRLRLHCGPGDDEKPVITLGLAGEL